MSFPRSLPHPAFSRPPAHTFIISACPGSFHLNINQRALASVQLKSSLFLRGLKMSQVRQRSKLPIRGLSGFLSPFQPHRLLLMPERRGDSQQKHLGKHWSAQSQGAGDRRAMTQAQDRRGPEPGGLSGVLELWDTPWGAGPVPHTVASLRAGGTRGRRELHFRMMPLIFQIPPRPTLLPGAILLLGPGTAC